MPKDMTPNYYVVSYTTFKAHFGERLDYYALHRPKKPVEHFDIS